MVIARLPHLIVGAPHERKPNVDRARRDHLRRHHADYGVRLIAKIQRATEHVGIALEEPLPKPIADDGEERAADAIFFFRECPSELRLQSEDLEKVRRHQASADLFGGASLEAAQVKRFSTRDRDVFEDGIVALPIEIVRKRNRNLRLVGVGLGDDHDPIPVRIRQRPEQDAIDHAEDRRVRADAEREREDRDEREARRFPELAEREAEVVHGALRSISPLLRRTRV